MAHNRIPNLLTSILKMKCPNCRRGDMFSQKSLFPLKHCLTMPERCANCGQKMELQIGFYYGTGYVSYALSVALFVFNLVWYWALFGISYQDNSIYSYLVTSIAIVLLLQPLIMRLSRVLYLYIFVRYGKGGEAHGDTTATEQTT
jgi:uncharacterized protein (DUF983 family)